MGFDLFNLAPFDLASPLPFDFVHPLALLLLPLALLPLLRRKKGVLVFSHVGWLPPDPVGRAASWLWHAIAVLGIATIVIGLASPGRSGVQLQRSGVGAEVLILMDRSTSMDAIIPPKGLVGAAGGLSEGESKNMVARELLSQFVTRRPDDRFGLTMFGSSVMSVAPFTNHNDAVLAGLAATAIGRGLPNTNMGAALQTAISAFEQRSYSGSRVILLMSDGGARLDAARQQRIAAGLARNRISLYFIYIRSSSISPDLIGVDVSDDGQPPSGTAPVMTGEGDSMPGTGGAQAALASQPREEAGELALHRFFSSLATPYRLYQSDDAQAMAAALAEIDRQQNLPLTFFERVPRQDDSGKFFIAALLCSILLLASRAFQLGRWT
jgi:mxaC protein